MAISVTIKELNGLQSAIDFISTNADGAEDYTDFQEMKDLLNSIWAKGRKDLQKRRVKYYLKKLKNKPPTP